MLAWPDDLEAPSVIHRLAPLKFLSLPAFGASCGTPPNKLPLPWLGAGGRFAVQPMKEKIFLVHKKLGKVCYAAMTIANREGGDLNA